MPYEEVKRRVHKLRGFFASHCGHAIIVDLLSKYEKETLGRSKAAVVYSIVTGCSLANAKAMVSEFLLD